MRWTWYEKRPSCMADCLTCCWFFFFFNFIIQTPTCWPAVYHTTTVLLLYGCPPPLPPPTHTHINGEKKQSKNQQNYKRIYSLCCCAASWSFWRFCAGVTSSSLSSESDISISASCRSCRNSCSWLLLISWSNKHTEMTRWTYTGLLSSLSLTRFIPWI